MPLEPVLTLLFVAVLANLVVMGAVLLPPLIGRKSLLSFGRLASAMANSLSARS